MSPSEFCAFLKGFFAITEAGRSDKSKPLALKPEQVAIIREKLLATDPPNKPMCNKLPAILPMEPAAAS